MKLYLDDIRQSPTGWLWCKSVEDAIASVTLFGVPEEMDLDHDLGKRTGMDFIKWLSEHSQIVPKWRVHSMNPVGKANMEAFLTSWENFTKENKC